MGQRQLALVVPLVTVTTWVLGLAVLVAAASSQAPSPQTPSAQARASGQAASPRGDDDGRHLFTGQARFANGGPPCGACHQISGLAFPNGGAVGPDLSGIYQTLGPEGTDVTLQTLYFPTMLPLYQQRQLTPHERAALKGFLARAGTTPVGPANMLILAGLAAAGFLILLAVIWLAWRHRLRGVRAPLVDRALAGGMRP